MATKILITDDHPLVLAGLRRILDSEKDFVVIGEAKDGLEAIKMVKKHTPDLVVMDITMPNLNGVDATKEILTISPESKVLALSIHSGKGFVKDMLDAGASGYLLKDSVPEELVLAIKKIVKGDIYLQSSITNTALSPAEPEERITILKTKLNRPLVTNNQIIRTKIIDKLENNIDKPLSLVSAPMGYGKSMTISQWLEQTRFQHTWLSLDEEHNELRNFLQYFLAAIEILFPGSLQEIDDILSVSKLPPLKTLTNNLINELDKIQQDFILVLDNYQEIHNNIIHEFINELLRFPPEHMHLVIITSHDPSLNLNPLRLSNRINEVRMDELSFSETEIIDLFKNLLSVDLNSELAKSLSVSTEGWIIGLQLIALSINKENDPIQILKNINFDDKLLHDFLNSEVLSKQSEEVQDLLTDLSILNRFCSDLIQEITQTENIAGQKRNTGNEVIQWLTKSDLLIVKDGTDSRWIRYHRLFQKLLADQLRMRKSPDEIAQLHKKASRWFDENGYVEDALHHAIKANDFQFGMQIFQSIRYALMNSDQWDKLNHLINKFPEEIIESDPLLLLSRAFYFEHLGKWPETTTILNQTEYLISQKSEKTQEFKSIIAELNALKSILHFSQFDTETAISCSIEALTNLPQSAEFIIANALNARALSTFVTGKTAEAFGILTDEIDHSEDFSVRTRCRLIPALGLLYYMDGNLGKLKETAMKGLSAAKKNQLSDLVSISQYLLSSAYYHRNEFNEALKYINQAHAQRNISRPLYYVQCCIIQSLIETAEGDFAKAWQTIEAVEQHASEKESQDSLYFIQVYKVDLAMRQGDYKLAEKLSDDINFELYPPSWEIHNRHLTGVKLMVNRCEFDEISHKFDQLKSLGQSIHNVNFMVHTLAVESAFYWMWNKKEEAFHLLTEALQFSRPGNYIRPYLDLGLAMKELFLEYCKKNRPDYYMIKIIDAFEAGSKKDIPIKEGSSDDLHHPTITRPERILLTHREVEVLKLVSDGLRNKEIAARLFVSDDAIKKHMYKMFQKLEVRNRTSLVTKAKNMGYLE